MRVEKISRCRISGDSELVPILNLGNQALTGVFPRSETEKVSVVPLSLVWNPASGLVQLEHDSDPSEMYGDNYGYRSGLNPTMVSHLQEKVEWLETSYDLEPGDVVVDIGSNDGTLLNSYRTAGLRRVGFDPVAAKFREFYLPSITVVPDFFTSEAYESQALGVAKVITSIAMFYDLEDPAVFVRAVRDSLASDGVWHFEQSYLPAMLRANAYDTVCHEHLEYYSLRVVKDLLQSQGLKILDVQTNEVNGGSFAVTAARVDSPHGTNSDAVEALLREEEGLALDTLSPYRDFEARVNAHREELIRLVSDLNESGKTVVAYGASTKGNVLLQFCGFGPADIRCVAEVNPQKFGSFTPGTLIPILSEDEVRLMKPDYMLVLPWHFRDFIVEKEDDYLRSGGHLIFPLPQIEIV